MRLTNQMRRNRKGKGGIFAERRSRVRKTKDRLTSRKRLVAEEVGRFGNPHSMSITKQLRSQKKKGEQ